MAKFVVYTTVDMKVIDIPVDLEFQKNMTRQLETFFENHFKPAYLDLHFFRSYSKYTFDDWVSELVSDSKGCLGTAALAQVMAWCPYASSNNLS